MSEEVSKELGAENPAEIEEFAELATELALAVPALRPRQELREQILRKIAATPQNPSPGVFVIPAQGGLWRKTRYAGVEYKDLYEDLGTGMRTVILRLEPGAVYPRHRHARPEQCFVLRGDVQIAEDVFLRAGDFEWADGGTEHAMVTSREGCELLIIASKEDEILA